MKADILVLGAGTGGLVAGNLLAAAGYKVTLVEKSDVHLFQPGMLWIAYKGHSPERYMRPVSSLVRENVELIKGTVKTVDFAERKVTLEDGREIEYNIIIVALGASLDYDAIPGHRELFEAYGDFFGGADAAVRMWENFSKLKEGTLVIAAADPVYKCPPAPHKAAFLAADTLAKKGLLGRVKVVLAVPFVNVYPSETMAHIVEEKLKEKGVEYRTMFTVDSIDLENKTISSLEGEQLTFDIAAVIPVHGGPRIEVRPEGVADDDEYIKVNKYTLRVEGYDDAFAIGDCSNAPTSKTGVTAHIGAEVVVDQILGYDARFTGRTNCPIVTNGEASFVISTYSHPPIPVKFSKMKRLMEDLFIAAYWSSLKYPELWRPVFHAYFEATMPEALGERGW